MRRNFLALLLICLPAVLTAACAGTDLRPSLDASERAALAQRLTDLPFNEGNRWRAERDGRMLTLVGTLHLDDPRFDPVMDRLRGRITSADLLLVEAGPAEEAQLLAAMAERPDTIFLTEGPSLIDQLPPDDWARLRDAAAARGVPGMMAAKLQPWYLSMILALPPCISADLQAGKRGLDHRVIDTANSAGVPIRALEPFDMVLHLFAADPMEDQIDVLRAGLTTPRQAEDGMATLRADYFDERHVAAIETARLLARRWSGLPVPEIDAMFDAATDKLVRDRNRAWMDRIRAADGDRIVIAVGAGHLGGEGGLLALLAADGWTLHREEF